MTSIDGLCNSADLMIDGKKVEVPNPRTRQALHNRQNGYVPHTPLERKAIEQTFKAYIGTTDIWGLA